MHTTALREWALELVLGSKEWLLRHRWLRIMKLLALLDLLLLMLQLSGR